MTVSPRVQISLGAKQYARLLLWAKRKRWPADKSIDAFARKYFLKALDEAVPEVVKEQKQN
jgi:hypothetical protein